MTRTMRMAKCCAVLLAIFTLGAAPMVPANNLGDVLRESGWDRLVGTWVDAETKGATLKMTYAWRFKDRVIEATSEERDKTSLSLIARNPKTGDVFNVSVDDQGGSSLGKWTFEKDTATLGLMFVTGKGEQGVLQLRYKLEDDDTLILTVVLPEPITIKMIRVKEEPKKDEADPKEPDAGKREAEDGFGDVENPFE